MCPIVVKRSFYFRVPPILSKVVVIKEESPKFFGLPALLLTEGHILKKSFYAKAAIRHGIRRIVSELLRASFLRAEP